MPITKSAKKALKQSQRRQVFNLKRKKEMKKAIKQTQKLIQEGKKEEAFKILPRTYKKIDKASKRGVIKKNNAARKKSRLTKAIQAS